MAQTFTSLSAPQVMLWGVLFFGGIYLAFGASPGC
jgi:lathosterol oxidase